MPHIFVKGLNYFKTFSQTLGNEINVSVIAVLLMNEVLRISWPVTSKVLGIISLTLQVEDSTVSGTENIWLNCMLWYIFLIEKRN